MSFFENLFGFSFNRKEKDDEVFSIVPPSQEDGATVIEGGGLQGFYVDLDGTLRTETDMIRKYREMSLHSEVDIAIDDVVNEAITEDARNQILKLNLDKADVPDTIKEKIQESFKEVLYLLDFDRKGFEIFRRFYIDGRLYYHIILNENKKKGAKEYRYIDPLRIKKIREIKEKERIGSLEVPTEMEEYYLYMPFNKTVPSTYNVNYNSTEQGIRIAPDSINYVHSGMYDPNTRKVIGYLHKAIKPLNQLRMVEDATVIYRWSRAPERRIFYIDVGSLPKNKAEQYLREVMNRYRNKVVYDANTGEIRDDKKHMSMLEDFWLPRREGGRGTSIETLPGGQNLGEMADVLYFQKKLYRALNIPESRLQADNGFNMGRASEISRDELKYSKFINRVRIRFGELILNFLKVQCLAKQIMNEDDWNDIYQNIKLDFSTDSYFAESKQAEVMKDRMAIMREVADYSGKFYSDYWIRKNILRQTDDDIAEIDSQIEQQKAEELAQMQTQQPDQQVPVAGGQETPVQTDPSQAPAPTQQSTFINNKGVDYDASSLL
jgi:5S rRNA maturation endonuclease (ribonuclease M5)